MPPIPLSFQQTFHWDNAQRIPDLNLNFPFALTLAGELDVERLRQSFETVIQRHGALRTRIGLAHGRPHQIVDPSVCGQLEVVSHWDDPTAEAEAYLNKPYELVGGRLFRARLLRLSSREHILLVCAHHLVMDAYSVNVLSNELWSCYGMRSPALPRLSLQYADYATRQAATHPTWLESHGQYWTERA